MQGTERADGKESVACNMAAAAYHVTAVATAQEYSPCLALIISYLISCNVIIDHVRRRHRLTIFLITAGTDPLCLLLPQATHS
jgi:hypothetical protein